MNPWISSSCVAALVGVVASGSFASTTDTDVLAQLEELSQELAEFKSEQAGQWLSEQRAAEVRTIVQDVLAEADSRASFQDSSATAGWNNGFFLASPDGNFKLNIGAMVQVRWMLNDAKEQPTTWGFSNARTQLNFTGNVVDPSWSYRIRLNTASGNTTSDFMFIEKAFDSGLNLRVGRLRTPFLRDTLVSSSGTLAIDRGNLNNEFGGGFSQGLQVGYATDDWRLNVAYLNGIRFPINTGLLDPPDTNWSFAGRFEYKFAGAWNQFNQETSFVGDDFGAMIGVAAAGQRYYSGFGTLYEVTVDATVQFGGANLSAAVVYRDNEWSVVELPNPWGANVKGGYFLSEKIEVFGRYTFVDIDWRDGKYSGVTVGMNYYLAGQNAKFTVDWMINTEHFGVVGVFPNSNLGERVDAPGEENQWVLRAQLQLMF